MNLYQNFRNRFRDIRLLQCFSEIVLKFSKFRIFAIFGIIATSKYLSSTALSPSATRNKIEHIKKNSFALN